MSKLTEHYRQLLGLDASWKVSDVSLSLEEKRVEILLVHRGGAVTCPECVMPRAGLPIMDLSEPGDIWTQCNLKQFCEHELLERSAKRAA